MIKEDLDDCGKSLIDDTMDKIKAMMQKMIIRVMRELKDYEETMNDEATKRPV